MSVGMRKKTDARTMKTKRRSRNGFKELSQILRTHEQKDHERDCHSAVLCQPVLRGALSVAIPPCVLLEFPSLLLRAMGEGTGTISGVCPLCRHVQPEAAALHPAKETTETT